MVRKIIWTRTAQKEQIAIFEYWNWRTKSKKYSLKLRKEFKKTTLDIQQFPFSGINTSASENIRLKIVSHFLLFYQIDQTNIYILSIFDSRRNPQDSPYQF